jgi:hypothetical protein
MDPRSELTWRLLKSYKNNPVNRQYIILDLCRQTESNIPNIQFSLARLALRKPVKPDFVPISIPACLGWVAMRIENVEDSQNH